MTRYRAVPAARRALPGAKDMGLMATATIPLGQKPKQPEDSAK